MKCLHLFMIRIFFAIISLCAVSHLQSQGIVSLAGAPPDSVIDQVLNKIDPDQELKLEHFNILFGHINTPIIKEQKKITVYCGMEIQDIRDINPSKGTYHVRGFIWYYWDDPRYRFNGDKIESLKWNYKTLSERMWLPQLDFDNSVNKLERWSETIEIFPDGMIEYWCYFSGEFSDQNGLMDFRLFPCEKLPVSIDVNTQYHSGLLEMKYCRLSTNEDIVLEIKKRRHPEFIFSNASVIPFERTYTSEWNRKFSSLRFIVEARRDKGYYFFHIFLPIASIMIVFLVGQRISNSKFDAKMGLCLTCLLSLIAYTFSFSESLPKLGYLTLMDAYITSNYLIIAAGTISTSIKHWSNPSNTIVRTLSKFIDKTLSVAAILLMISFVGLLFFL